VSSQYGGRGGGGGVTCSIAAPSDGGGGAGPTGRPRRAERLRVVPLARAPRAVRLRERRGAGDGSGCGKWLGGASCGWLRAGGFVRVVGVTGRGSGVFFFLRGASCQMSPATHARVRFIPSAPHCTLQRLPEMGHPLSPK
jgi:hypothetical protein